MKAGPFLFIVVYLAIQLALPIRAMLRPLQPTHFGWRMFLDSLSAPRFEIGFRDGRVLDLAKVEPKIGIPLLGAQVDQERFVPPHLCRQLPDAVWIRVHSPPFAPTEHACR